MLTWTQRSTPTASNNFWRGLCYSPELGRFVAVGGVNAAGTSSVRVMTSDDGGETWTLRDTGITGANPWNDVCWAPALNLFIAVRDTGVDRVMTSPDGITWTARSASSARLWASVAWSPTLTLAVAAGFNAGGSGRLMTSPDGVNWTDVAVTNRTYANVRWSAALGLFIASAVTANASAGDMLTSPNGTVWTNHESPAVGTAVDPTGASSLGGHGLAVSDDLPLITQVLSSNSDPILTSPDGSTWTQQTIVGLSWRGCGWTDPTVGFVAVGNTSMAHQVAESLDGVTWSDYDPAPGTDEPWRVVAYASDTRRVVVLADNTNNDGLSVMTADVPGVQPTVISIAPDHGPVIGGTAVTITGTNFADDATVVFGSGDDAVDATSIVVVDTETITCVTPAHAVGATDVTVTNPGSDFLFDTLEGGFTYEYEPGTPLSLTPNQGTFAGGTPVTITGSGFVDGATVAFDGVAATEVVVVNSTTITCVTPPHAAEAVDVTVENP